MKELDITNCKTIIEIIKQEEQKDHGSFWSYGEDDIGLLVSFDKKVKVIMGDIIIPPTETNEEKIDISDAIITLAKKAVYTGKSVTPELTVVLDGKILTADIDYTVAYANNKAVGTAKVTVTGQDRYTGVATAEFDIIPKAITNLSLKAGKKQLTVKWKKAGVTGYEIQYSLKKKLKNAKTVIITKAKTVKATIDKLKAKKTYYVRIRAYKTVKGKKYYSEWSEVMKIKIK